MLTGETIQLRPPLADDATCLTGLRNDVEVQAMLMALPRAGSARRVQDWIEGALNDPQGLFFIIADRMTNEALGFVQLRRMDFVHGTGELGICLAAPARGKAAGAQAIALVERHARDVFRIRKVVLQVLESNRRAISCYLKCGYRQVGVLNEHFYHAGRHHNAVVMEHLLEGRT